MTFIIYILIFCVGIVIGIVIKVLLERKKDFIGTIVVIKSDDKILYSLEMDDSPETLQFRTKAYFKVRIPDEESNRR